MGTVFRRTYLSKRTGQRRKVRVYSIRYKTAAGDWTTEPTKETKKYLAERLLLQREAEIERERAAPANLVPRTKNQDGYLEEIKVAYLADCHLRLRPSTYRLYEERLVFTLRQLQIERVSELTLASIDEYGRQRLAAGASPRTVNLQVTVLRRMLGWAVDRDWPGVDRNPLKKFRPLREVRKRKRRALQPAEARRLFQHAPPHRRIIWVVALASGLRRQELVLLEMHDFDADRGLLIVHPEISKSCRSRVIPIPSGLAELLQQWLKDDLTRRRQLMEDYLASTLRRLAAYEKAGLGDSSKAESLRHLEDKIISNLDHRRLFRNGRGLPYLKSNLLREFRGDVARGRGDVARGSVSSDCLCLCLQDLRRSNATLLRAANVPEIAIKQRLGHVSIETTDRHYVDLDRVDTGLGTEAVAAFLGVSNGRPKPGKPGDGEATAGILTLESDEPLRPTPDVLAALAKRYRNVVIGRIFDVTEASVRKWMAKSGIVRDKRQVNREQLTDADIAILRAEVRMMLARAADGDGQP